MATTTQPMGTTLTATGRSHESRWLSRALLIALAALAAITVAVTTWQLTTTARPTAPTQQVSRANADQFGASRQGGSVYRQQVPQAAADQRGASGQGGSVYRQQVPQAAVDQWAPYRAGGSVYGQQVPQAAR